ncbi:MULTISPECIES: YdcF family protein [unclassified Fusibacter]|uniref:YdcF family protein n=1 Tax=unclassified Fusibacter TaxID=2624464 RepID=UPI001012142A|nr:MULTISPECIES: YdcF family protein [unclassified Fusibacter]MCK8060254.1 YdcF family protein [Fusibacter sp. A2]NPE20458.1 YdcF family protein [Fusibacter sp. A1]RXV63663.1 YdcF family protein [Fusibacter sp. A1]
MRNSTYKKISIRLIAGVIIFVIFIISSTYPLIHSEKTSEIEDLSNTDILIVLGAGLWGDRVSPQLALRLKTAFEIIRQNDHMTIIVSGGQGPDELVSEAQAMKDYLVKLGVDKNRILLEDKSTSTFENITYSLELIKKNQLSYDKLAFVTTDFHVYRAKMLFKRLGMQVEGKSAPNIASIVVKNNVREVFALIKDFLVSH